MIKYVRTKHDSVTSLFKNYLLEILAGYGLTH